MSVAYPSEKDKRQKTKDKRQKTKDKRCSKSTTRRKKRATGLCSRAKITMRGKHAHTYFTRRKTDKCY